MLNARASDLFLQEWVWPFSPQLGLGVEKAQECAFLDTEICEKCTAPRALWKGINSRTISDLNNLGDVQFHHDMFASLYLLFLFVWLESTVLIYPLFFFILHALSIWACFSFHFLIYFLLPLKKEIYIIICIVDTSIIVLHLMCKLQLSYQSVSVNIAYLWSFLKGIALNWS